MKLYKGTLCDITLAGTLEEAPIIYNTDHGKQVAEFFLTVYKSDEQFFLYRVIATNSEALKIKHYAQFGAQLFVAGEIQGYQIMQSSDANLVVAEVVAHKLWFANSSELNQLDKKQSLKPIFFEKNVSDVGRSHYLH